MKKTALLVVLCMLFVMFPFTSVAEGTLTTEKIFELGEPVFDTYVENQLIVWTDEFWEPVAVSANKRPINFYGIEATEIKPLFTATAEGRVRWSELSNDRYPYLITIKTPLSESKNVLCYESHILEIMYNYVFEAPEFESASGSASRSTSNSGTGVDYTQWSHEYLNISTVWSMGFVGSSDIRVAVLDNGFEEHDDLENNLDMSLAHDAYDFDTNIVPDSGHGNGVAGIIGADYNDGGINGLCKNVTMIPIKVTDNNGDSYSDYQIHGVNKAIELGADIINLSYAMNTYTAAKSATMISLIEENNILFVTSAGNGNEDTNYIGLDVTNTTSWVGKRNDSPNYIVVGAMTQQEEKSQSSHYSSVYVDLFAPTNVSTTSKDNDYYINGGFRGTSASAPHVTAACVLLMSKATHKTPLQIRQLILDNVKTIDGFDEYCVTGGTLSIINAINALYEENRGAYTLGDVSGDGYIDSSDYMLCRRICFGSLTPTELQFAAADVNEDGIVDSADYTLINRYVSRTYYFAPY